jgi:Rieske 2Fe-2S family protein
MSQESLDISTLIREQVPGLALAQRFYTDPGIYELELRRVITRNWIVAGHQSELPAEGDFKVFKVANESAIIVRGKDGALCAFANVCRHRGSLVCLEPGGNTDKFMCPYHGWVYGLDGRLTAARSMPDDFDRSNWGLKPVSLELLGGFMLVCFSEQPPGLESARAELAEPMAIFDFENLKLAAHKAYDIPANWKLAVENYQECYHCATAHPEYSQRHTLRVDWRRRTHLQQDMIAEMEACGLRRMHVDRLDTKAPPGEMGFGYSRTAMFEGYLTGSRDGKPLAPLLGELKGYDGGASDFSFGGFSFLLAYSDHVVCYVFTPVDARNCRCDIYWLVRGDAVEGSDYDVDELTWLWDVTTQADKTIIVNNWKGVQSRFYSPGPFSEMESAERIWTEWLLQELQKD